MRIYKILFNKIENKHNLTFLFINGPWLAAGVFWKQRAIGGGFCYGANWSIIAYGEQERF